MRELEDTKFESLESLAKSVGLDQEEIVRIKSSKRRKALNKLNPVYWFNQLMIFLISLFYSVIIGVGKQNATYPFESNHLTIFLAPVPLSAHLINAIYSITGADRSGLSKKIRLLVFFVNFSLFASVFYIYFLSVPKVYHSGVLYSVFDATESRKTF